ncbi:MAG TPA: hypothetical protein VJN65_02570 [Bacteroidota bacterium]|nr:hypothetical protein [Bacteroidota bacterium]
MSGEQGHDKRFQWKWVWITVGMFAVFYVLPILAVSSFRLSFGGKIIGGWSFGGIVVIAAVSAMLSKGVTIWEPAVGGALMSVAWYIIFQVLSLTGGSPLKLEISRLVVTMVAIFGLSLLGAGLGEGIQNVRRKDKETAGK